MTTDLNSLNSQRVFKKSSLNNRLTLYLSSRDLLVEGDQVDRIRGVLHVEPGHLEGKKLFGQVILTFRYGREDEEVMGLKFCNEAIMSLAQVWPPPCAHEPEKNTPLQEALLKRLGANAYPFQLELTPLAPPSVQLVPAKRYHGAPIGTSYDVRAYIAERADEKVPRRGIVCMGIRVLQGCAPPPAAAPPPPRSSHVLSALTHRVVRVKKTKPDIDSTRNKREEIENQQPPPPRVAVEKPFLLSDGTVELEAWLDKATYTHGESIRVGVVIDNRSSKTVRRIKALAVQHVDVCMFSNGKFKNVVALAQDAASVAPRRRLADAYTLTPHRGVTKNWIALEDSYSKSGAELAASVRGGDAAAGADRNVFAIYVSYYVKVKLSLSGMGGEVSVKLPFTLTHSCINEAPTDSVTEETTATQKVIHEDTETAGDDKQNNNEEGETPAPTDDTVEHHCVDVLVNIENTIERAKTNEAPAQVCSPRPAEEMDRIEKYSGADT